MDLKIRKEIERHFYNYKKEKVQNQEQQQDILLGNLATDPERPLMGDGKKGSITEHKGFRLIDLRKNQTWTQVIDYTLITYKHGPEYPVIVALYFDRKPIWYITNRFGVSHRTLWRWKYKWLNTGLYWAEEFGLVKRNIKNWYIVEPELIYNEMIKED